jgi:hypothetical protein
MSVARRSISPRRASIRSAWSAAAASSAGGAAPEDVEAEGEGVQRVLDLVRQAGREVADLGTLLGGGEAGEELLAFPQRRGHPVEGDRELPDLVGPVDGDDDVELAVRDLPRRLGDGLDGARGVPRDDEDDDEPDAEHAEQRVEAPPEVVLELGPDVLERVLDRHLPEVTPLDDERDDDLARAAPLADDPLDLDVLGDAPGRGRRRTVVGGSAGAPSGRSSPPCLIRISRTPFCFSRSRNSSSASGSREPPGPIRVAAAWIAVASVL